MAFLEDLAFSQYERPFDGGLKPAHVSLAPFPAGMRDEAF